MNDDELRMLIREVLVAILTLLLIVIVHLTFSMN